MSSFFVVSWPRVERALLGAIIAGVATKDEPEWYEAIAHCVGSAHVGAGVMSWFIGTPVGPAYFGFFHVLMFWLVVPERTVIHLPPRARPETNAVKVFRRSERVPTPALGSSLT